MKGLIAFLLTGILTYVAGLFYQWWGLAVIAFVIALLIRQHPVKAFFTAFLAVFVLWFGISFFIDLSNDHLLANRMSLLILKTQNPIFMCVISGLVGGIVAGFSALSASFLRKKKKSPNKPSYV